MKLKLKKYYYKSKRGTILECDEPLSFYVKARVLNCSYGIYRTPGTVSCGWNEESFTEVQYKDIKNEIKK